MKPTLHLIGIFHTIHNQSFSHCAFTGKALRFPKMMQEFGWNVIEYSNEGSESAALDKVVIISAERFAELRPDNNPAGFHGDWAVLGNPLHQEFETQLLPALQQRVKPGDIICHPFGHAHSRVVGLWPHAHHVETGIGYSTVMDGTFKIFESEAWRHTHIERANRAATNYEWVIPNYFDLDEWEVNTEPGSYVAFLGRICQAKGLDTVLEIARRSPIPIALAGQGDYTPWSHPNIVYRGPLVGAARNEFLRNARCSIMPTEFVEPFGGSGIEGMLCGTPLVSVNWGAFTETVQEGITGYRCQTLKEWLSAISKCQAIDRARVAEVARSKYSLSACGALYDRALTMISDLAHGGWYAE